MSDDIQGLGKRASSRKTSAPERYASAGYNVSAEKRRAFPKIATAGGPVRASGGPLGGAGKAADAPPDSASLIKKRTKAFIRHMLDGPGNKNLRRIVVGGHEHHEEFGCGMLHVNDIKDFHWDLMKMMHEDTEGIWPVGSDTTWPVYSMLRQNGFKEMYFGQLMFGDPVKERGAPPGEMMWYRRYRYTHQNRLDAEGETPLSESGVLALATAG